MFFCSLQAGAQYEKEDNAYKKYFIGSSFFVLGNLVPKNRPDFVQLNFGYRITGKDVLSLELKTWKYGWPLGIPYGKSFEAFEEIYKGIGTCPCLPAFLVERTLYSYSYYERTADFC